MFSSAKRLHRTSVSRITRLWASIVPISAALVVAACVAAPKAARAQASIVNINTTDNAVLTSITLGYSFTVTGNQTITGLGLFDLNANGLIDSHLVGLWNSSHVLIASTTVTTANSVAVDAPTAQGNWRDTSITPMTLSAGTYYVGAYYSSSTLDGIVYGGPVTSVNGFTYLADANQSGASLAFPGTSDGHNSSSGGYFGGTVFVGGATAPEPGSIALALSSAALPLAGFIRKRRTAARV